VRFWVGSVTVLLMATHVGAGDQKLAALARDFVKTGTDLRSTLTTIKDKKTAEAAKDRLVSVFKQLQSLEKRINDLSQEQLKRLQEKHGKELATVMSVDLVLKESLRLRKLPDVLEVFRGTQLLWDFFGQTPVGWARKDLVTLSRAVDAYVTEHGVLPPDLGILTVPDPAKGKAILERKVLFDPWNRPYMYDLNTLHPATSRPLIYSQGPNPKDSAGRIYNWESPKKP
jgi:hypothetical protein